MSGEYLRPEDIAAAPGSTTRHEPDGSGSDTPGASTTHHQAMMGAPGEKPAPPRAAHYECATPEQTEPCSVVQEGVPAVSGCPEVNHRPRERPILFSGEMVRAILAGKKTQTRRLVTPQPFSNGRYIKELGDIVCHNDYLPPDAFLWERRSGVVLSNYEDDWTHECSPFGKVGDRLWVREMWRPACEHLSECTGPGDIRFAASVGEAEWATMRWRPSIHMPRWASRLSLEVTSVRVDRLQDLSEDDARAEGCDGDCPVGYIPAWQKAPCTYHYAQLWDDLNGKRAPWESNPWVWVVSFQPLAHPHPPQEQHDHL